MSATGDLVPDLPVTRYTPSLSVSASVSHLSATASVALCGAPAERVEVGQMAGYLSGLPRCRRCQRIAAKEMHT